MLIILGLIIVIGATWEILSIVTVTKGIDYIAKPSCKHIEEGQSVTVQTTISNKKWLPVAFMRVTEFMPASIVKGHGEPVASTGEKEVVKNKYTLFIKGRQRIIRTIHVKNLHRGVYPFNGCDIEVGDFLGLVTKELEYRQQEELLCYPGYIQRPDLARVLRQTLGEIVTNSLYLKDPATTVGYREYTGREPMKSINWKVSARQGRIMCKEHEATRMLTATLILDNYCPYSTSPQYLGLEECYRMIRSCVEQMGKEQLSFAFYTNASLHKSQNGSGRLQSALPGTCQREEILDILSRATIDRTCMFENCIEKISKLKLETSCYLIITPDKGERVDKAEQLLKELTGTKVMVLSTFKAGEVS